MIHSYLILLRITWNLHTSKMCVNKIIINYFIKLRPFPAECMCSVFACQSGKSHPPLKDFTEGFWAFWGNFFPYRRGANYVSRKCGNLMPARRTHSLKIACSLFVSLPQS